MNLARKRSTRLDPAGLRLPLIALIDVVLFLLFYFIIAGNIDAEEAELASTLAIAKGSGTSSFLESQLLWIEAKEGRPVYRIGGHEFNDRMALLELLRKLPKDPGVVVRAADQVELQNIATAIQVVRDAGFVKITYVPGS